MADHTEMTVWQFSRKVVISVSRICVRDWRPWFAAMFSQVQRSSLSVQLNIAEGYALWYPKQRHRHLRIAYGSAVETVEVLELMRELQAAKSANIDELIDTERRVCRMLVSWLKRIEPVQ